MSESFVYELQLFGLCTHVCPQISLPYSATGLTSKSNKWQSRLGLGNDNFEAAHIVVKRVLLVWLASVLEAFSDRVIPRYL